MERDIIMKEIYELLNNVEINLDEYDDQKLSNYESKVIKRQILKEIKKLDHENKKKGKGFRTSIVAACLCALIGVGGISVAAAAGLLPVSETFREIFGINSTEKSKVADKMGSAIHISDEDNGYKITAEGVINDNEHIYVVYKIEKSDGSSLYKNKGCTNVDFWNFKMASWVNGSVGRVEQEYTSKYIRYYTKFTIDKKPDYQKSIKASLGDMRLWFGEEEIEVDGDWHFNLPLQSKDYSVDLADCQKISYGKTTGKLEELKISPIAYSVKVSSSDELSGNKLIKYLESTGKMVLYLKNGKQIGLGGGSWVTANQDGTWTFSVSGSFENLILPENMEKVMIGDSEFNLLQQEVPRFYAAEAKAAG